MTVVNQAGGYRLTAGRDQIDLFRFRDLVVQARRPSCTAQERVEMLRQAVSLHRGDPLTGVAGTWATGTREHLIGELLTARADRADAELAVGSAPAVLVPLSALAQTYPLEEPLVRALVARRRRLVAVVAFCATLAVASGAVRFWPSDRAVRPDHSATARFTAIEDFSGTALQPARWSAHRTRHENGSSWSPAMVRVGGGELQITGSGRSPDGRATWPAPPAGVSNAESCGYSGCGRFGRSSMSARVTPR